MINRKIIKSALQSIATEKAAMLTLEQILQQSLAQHIAIDSKGDRDSLDNSEQVKPQKGDLASSFSKAVELIYALKGRLVVTGLGKSGHIASKIASSLASTGTPAFFVHAAEANHGDLGMIGQDDAVLALSWSGETTELSGIINYAARLKIPLLAISAGEKSALVRQADIALLLPKILEACPNGLAPTSSTLLQLALGDALTVALLELRGFTEREFKLFHPGGNLGAQLRYVADIMHMGDELPLVPMGLLMPEAMEILSQKHFGCVLVLNQSAKLAGIITEGDLARNIKRDISQLKVEEVMSPEPKIIEPHMLVSEAAALIQRYQVSALPVVEQGEVKGLLHFHDLFRLHVI